MKQKLLLKTLLLLCILVGGVSNAWADDQTLFDVTNKSNWGTSNSSYSSTIWSSNGCIFVQAANNNKGWAYVRLGGKKITGVDAYIATTIATTIRTKQLDVTVAQAKSNNGLTINSITLYVYQTYNSSTKTYSNEVEHISYAVKDYAAGTMTFEPSNDDYWESGVYFKLVYNVSVSANSNYGTDISKLVAKEYTSGGGGSSDPSISLGSTSVNATAAAVSTTSIEVTYNNLTNYDANVIFYESDGTTEATYDHSWMTAEINSSTKNLDYSITANTGDARTAYLKIYALGDEGDAESDLLTVLQAAYIPVTGVSLDKTSKSLLVDGTVTLEATVSPDDATNKNVTWESDDEDVVTVDKNGKVTAVAEGTAKITVKSVADPTKKAECTITVTDGSIDLEKTGEIEITSFPSFSGSGYKSADPYTIGDYDWVATDCMKSSSNLQLKASSGKITSPTIKCPKGFTVTVTVPTNSVTVSDGTNSASTSNGSATLTTTKTSTKITISAGGSYAQVSKITITPSKDPVATGVAITDPGTLAKDATGTFTYTATTEEDNTASWTSATTGVITITDAASGAYTATGRGTSKIMLTLTPTDATTYNAVKAERIVTVTVPVEVSANDVEMTYGDATKAIGATTSAEYAGTLTYESGNTSIATVDASGNVTAVAAGTTTITISAPADAEHFYTAGSDVVIDVTVNAPAGGTTAKTTTPVVVASNTLLSNSLPVGWTGDGSIWSGSSSYGAVAASGTDGSTYDLKTATINLNGNYSAASVTFQHTGKTFDTPSNACNLYVKDGDTETQVTINTYFAGDSWTYVTNTTSLNDYIGKSIQLIFRYTPVSGDNGKWEVKNFAINATPSTTELVTLNPSGYATFCSKNPLDFSKENAEDKGYTAWQITDIDGSTITFSQITGTIKGGQGVLLKGEAGATVTLASADASTMLEDNLFFGTTAPTYVAADTYYGLSGNKFVKVNAGTVPAGKALLPASTIPASARELSFVFEGETTGISEECRVKSEEFATAIYDLQGRKVSQPKKGLYIMDGKKVMIK